MIADDFRWLSGDEWGDADRAHVLALPRLTKRGEGSQVIAKNLALVKLGGIGYTKGNHRHEMGKRRPQSDLEKTDDVKLLLDEKIASTLPKEVPAFV